MSDSVCTVCECATSIADVWCEVCGESARPCKTCGELHWCQFCSVYVCEDCSIYCTSCKALQCAFCPFDSQCTKCGRCDCCVELDFNEEDLTFTCNDCSLKSGRWTKEEVRILEKMLSENASRDMMAETLCRGRLNINSKIRWLRLAKGHKHKKRVANRFNWVPVTIVEVLSASKVTNHTLSIQDIRTRIFALYPERCDNNDKTRLGKIRWKSIVSNYLCKYPCFQRVENPEQPIRNPLYRLLDMKDLGEIERDLFTSDKSKNKKRHKFSFKKAMNFVKAFRK